VRAALDAPAVLGELQQLLNVLLTLGRRRGGECHEGHLLAQLCAQLAQLLVLGPEVVPPRGHAVRLVHDDPRELPARGELLQELQQARLVRVRVRVDVGGGVWGPGPGQEKGQAKSPG
jgi:hypothetical protein